MSHYDIHTADAPPEAVAPPRRSRYEAARRELLSRDTGRYRWVRIAIHAAESKVHARRQCTDIQRGRGGWALDEGEWETRLAHTSNGYEVWVHYVAPDERPAND